MAATLDQTMDVTNAKSLLAALRRNRLLTLAAGLILLQGLFFGWWIWRETMARGMVIRVPLAVYDPRDLLRGQYMNLSYPFQDRSSYPGEGNSGRVSRGETVHAVLRRDGETGLFMPFVYHNDRGRAIDIADAILLAEEGPRKSFKELEGTGEGVILRGRAKTGWSFDFGGSRLFVPEGSEEPPTAGAVAIVVVTPSGRIRVEGLEIDGERWRPGRGR